jgi:hypothetical protein
MKNLCKIIIVMICVLSVLFVLIACKKNNGQPQESSSVGEESSTGIDSSSEESSSEDESSSEEESSNSGFAEGANRNDVLGPGWTDWYPSDFSSK